ncbi:MAG TPA: DUF2188 domain-containing protein [Polyangiaceae bacterium]|jgi:hypothetical protein
MNGVFHVRWMGTGWEVQDRKGKSLSEPRMAQAEAVMHAKELARREGTGQIIVHDMAGTVVSEFFYQRAERSALAYDDASPSFAASRPVRKQPA